MRTKPLRSATSCCCTVFALLIASASAQSADQQTGFEPQQPSTGHANSTRLASDNWEAMGRELKQNRDRLKSATATAAIQWWVQFEQDSAPTKVNDSTARIWYAAPKYRVHVKSDIRLVAPRKHDARKDANETGIDSSLVDTKIAQQLIIFDGHSTFEAIKYRDGSVRKINSGRRYELPLLFAGFPYYPPVFPAKRLLDPRAFSRELVRCVQSPSGGIYAVNRTGEHRHRLIARSGSFSDIERSIAVSVLGRSETTLNWGESNGIAFVKQFNSATSRSGSSIFRRGAMTKHFEFTRFDANVAISPAVFSTSGWPPSVDGQEAIALPANSNRRFW
ncbi:MAG TPA: hypothetical protein DDW52_14340 [Planctomycetaceae bacterium]|nr:hypothetical protein [Planctomycetaceae bacterium]